MIDKKIAYLVKIYGIVQGIGYRPYIYKKAKKLNIKGWVNNLDSSVIIKAESYRENITKFLVEVIKKPPKLAEIQKVEVKRNEIEDFDEFIIKRSKKSNTKLKFILPDIATCDKCAQDIFNKDSKRYRYAFTNCSLCGPRYSIIKSLPYDRCNTTMNEFKMCSKCEKEYKNPATRRFHAEPTCCKDCGPKLNLTDNKGNKISSLDQIKKCAELLKKGYILGIKGIGGFHIVCNAIDEKAVLKIRQKKKRRDKPLALMMKNIDEVKKYCEINKKEEEVITNNKRPIVILNKKFKGNLSKYIAPNVNKLGVMLPYTPIHYLLFAEELPPLVMTSGNISGSPIEYTNEEAIKNLSNIVDYFLLNDREINIPIDDSVVKIINNKVLVSRPGRGYSPYYIYRKIKKNILACGSEDKSTFAFSLSGNAYMSQYLGDLKDLDCYKNYIDAINNIKTILDINPHNIAFDRHPAYNSTLYGKGLGGKKISTQHHHAHMASCMLEHNIYHNCIGIIYDGTGYGEDKNIWGGEFFIGNRKKFKRVGHLKYVKIQGGDSAQKNIWKIGLSYLNTIKDKKLREFGEKRLRGFLERQNIDNIHIDNVLKALKNNLNSYNCSSLGRLYDAISSIIGVRQIINYDGQGAIELENIIDESVSDYYNYSIKKEEDIYIVDICFLISKILKDTKEKIPNSIISTKFHNTIINITVDMSLKLRKDYDLNTVILSGGVFENEYLLKNTYENLKNRDFNVIFNENIPTNDNGLSLGQLAIADEILKEGEI